MIENCPKCGAGIDTTEAEPLTPLGCPACGQEIRPKHSFDYFKLVEPLGAGGTGTVYKARDTRADRFVALKLLRRELGGQQHYRSRLENEAAIVASINHPNVIQIISSGAGHGHFYIVMELLTSGTLDEAIEKRKRLPEEEVLEIGIQVAGGLHAAHEMGLVHRDVKPANILFADDHSVKIRDFGIAGGTRSQPPAEIWGTPYYVAPERLTNQPDDLRGDIYSLGATLFHAIAGQAPIKGNTNSAAELLELKKNPLDLRELAPETSDPSANLVQRMIAPDPERRFSSYEEVISELERARRT